MAEWDTGDLEVEGRLFPQRNWSRNRVASRARCSGRSANQRPAHFGRDSRAVDSARSLVSTPLGVFDGQG